MSLFLYRSYKLTLILFAFCTPLVGHGQYFVDFEGDGESKGSYALGTITLSGLEWEMEEAMTGTLANDWKNGVRSARLRGYGSSRIEMLQNKTNGIGIISFYYRRYGTDTQVDWRVEYSTNDGVDWIQIGDDFTAPVTDDVQFFSEEVNECGDIRVRIKRATETGGTLRRLNIDDITISDCVSGDLLIDELLGLNYLVDCDNGDFGDLDFSSTNTFAVGNEFIVQLSNSTGDFDSPLQIGSLSGTEAEGENPAGNIDFTIPPGIPDGDAYRIRLISTDHSLISADNGTDITIESEFCPFILPASEGLLINEFSNGSSGDKEYYEFVVAGSCGELVDIRGYIIDDNNGTFTADYTDPTGSGISRGHMRLTNHAQWESIPVGSLIIVYNASDFNDKIPADDPFDADNDSLYIIPHNFSDLLEITTELPNVTTPDSTYSPVSEYSSTSWNPLQLRDGGDVIQARSPDGTYFHGVSYGSAEISGGPQNMKVYNGNMAGMCGWFTSGDYLDVNNWSVGGLSFETPGAPNNESNEAWLKAMRDPFTDQCPITVLPVTLYEFKGYYNGSESELMWTTYTEQDNNYFNLFHSTDGYDFKNIGSVKGSGNSLDMIDYQFIHRSPKPGINYYKLESVDFDGTKHDKGIISVIVDISSAYYDRSSNKIKLQYKSDYGIYTTSGQLVKTATNENSIPFVGNGIYIVRDFKSGKTTKLFITPH